MKQPIWQEERSKRRRHTANDRTAPIPNIGSLQKFLTRGSQRFQTEFATVVHNGSWRTFAATALLMATIGLYGVSATAAAARSRGLAIRAAISAHPTALLRLIVQQGLFTCAVGVFTCAVGVALGAAASLAATRGLGAFLYETGPRDPATFAATALLLFSVAAMATYLPARRALAANPAEVLRAE